MNLVDFRKYILPELARIYNNRGMSEPLLDRLGFPGDRIIWGRDAREFWNAIAREVDAGIIKGKDLCSLLQELRTAYPGSQVFAQREFCQPGGPDSDVIHHITERRLREFQRRLATPSLTLRPTLQPGGELLDEWFYSWLTGPGPAGAFLLSKLGSGKTYATALLVEQVRLRAEREGLQLGPVIWLRLREFDLIGRDPDTGFQSYFKETSLFSIWSSNPPVSCFILDGFDEIWLRHPEERIFSWLGTLLDRARDHEPRPRILITGRDIVLRPLLHGRQLSAYLEEYSGISVRRNGVVEASEPLIVSLSDFHDPTLRMMLRESLRQEPSIPLETVEFLVAKIRPGLLSSPLLFGFADDLLHALFAEPEDEIGPLNSEWELTDAWLLRALDREIRPRQPPFADLRTRLEAAEHIALCLLLTGAGTDGLSLDDLHRALEALNLPPLEPVLLANGERELRRRALMKKCSRNRIAPFHEALLIHLAARALERLASTVVLQEDGSPPAGSGSEGADQAKTWTQHGGGSAEVGDGVAANRLMPPRVSADEWLGELARRLNRPLLLKTLDILQNAREIQIQGSSKVRKHDVSGSGTSESQESSPMAPEASTWVKGSLSRSVLAYWIGQGPSWRAVDGFSLPRAYWGDLEPVGNAGFISALSSILDDHDLAQRIEHEVEKLDIRTGLVSSSSHPWPPSPGETNSLREDDTRWLAIPSGRFQVWRLYQRFRVAETVEVPHGIFLARDLVTVEEFARFLADTDEPMPLDGGVGDWPPQREIVGWKRTTQGIVYQPEYADLPIVGVDRDQAKRYCDWFSSRHPTEVGTFTLPEREWLQVAVWGRELGEPRAVAFGPFGHRDLTGRRWQWAAGSAGQSCVFGGSRGLGHDALSIHATLVRGWPDLCWSVEPRLRHADIGFRLALVANKAMMDRAEVTPQKVSK